MPRADCTDWSLLLMQLAMNISSQDGTTDLDSVVKRMQEVAPEGVTVTREKVVDAIVEATERGPSETTEIQKTVNKIKAEAREDRRLTNSIEELQSILDKGGTFPVTEKKAAKVASQAVQELRDMQKQLRAQLKNSEPVRKKKIEGQINELESILTEGKFTPKVKPAETPISRELDFLIFKRDELRREIHDRIDKLKPQSVWTKRFDKLNVIRSMMTSIDLSAVFRQGGFMVFSNPFLTAKSMIPMFKATFSKESENTIHNEILNRYNAIWYRRTNLALTEPGGKISQGEEAYQSDIAKKIPLIGPFIAASERGYTTFLNRLRADAFDTFAATLTKDGSSLTMEQATAITRFINAATGRGGLQGAEGAATAMNAMFFSPRLMSSRFQMVFGALAPGTFFPSGKNRSKISKKAPKEVRRLIRAQYAKYLIGMGLFYTMAFLAFGDDDEFGVETNMTSSDWGKLRFGNTRVDPLSGLSQTIVLLARITKGEMKSTFTQNIKRIRGPQSLIPFGGKTGLDVTEQFFENKFSPLLGTFVDVALKGHAFAGEELTLKHFATRYLPMTFEEVTSSIQEQGLGRGAAMSLAVIFGMGVSTYGNHMTAMNREELEFDYYNNVYKRDQTVTRGSKKAKPGVPAIEGTKVRVKKGQPHVGEEGRVEALRRELRKKGVKSVKGITL